MRFRIPALYLALVGGGLPLLAKGAEEKSASGISLLVEADYLALHARGTAPPGASSVEHRLTMNGAQAQPGPWVAAPPKAADGGFRFDVPLPDWRWARLEVRALAGGQTLATQQAGPRKRSFAMLTPERIAALPEADRSAWRSYLDRSILHAGRERDVIAAECRNLGMAASQAAPHGRGEFEMGDDVPAAWFGGPDAIRIAGAVLSYQTPAGAWSKAVNYAIGPRPRGTHWTSNADNPWHYCGTLDNRSTSEQIKFLANVHSATKRDDARVGALRGIEWLLAAQFPNGGWPQVYPVEPGYHEAITLNDGAMLHALEVLLSVSRGEAPFAFVDETLRQRAAAAFGNGIRCLMDCQVRIEGKAAVWCAQHDPLSLEPVAARLKEPPSLSGAESADVLGFLMREGPVTAATVSAVQAGIDWLDSHRITNLRKTKDAGGRTDYAVDEASSEIRWARFYDVQTGLPIFAGAQDGRIYNTFHEMALHNNVAYDYFTTKPADVIGKEANRWRKRARKTGR